jgi:ABC-type sugar transport system substrate-binding protein
MRLAASLLAAALGTVSLFGCGAPKGKGGKRYKIAVIAQAESQFWTDVKTGAQDAADELGYELMYYNTQNITQIAEQQELVKQAKNDGANAICIAANSGTNSDLLRSLKAAANSDIQIFTLDADVTVPQVPASTDFTERRAYIGTNYESAGATAGRNAAAYLAGAEANAKAVVICHSEISDSAASRAESFTTALNEQVKALRIRDLQQAAMGGAPNGQGGAPNGQGGAPNGQGDAQNGQGGAPNGQGDAQNGQGDAQNGQGDAQNGQGNAQNGQGGAPNGQGGAPNGQGTGPSVLEMQIQAINSTDFVFDTLYTDGTGVAQNNAGENSKDAETVTKNVLEKHPEVKVLYATDETTTLGVCKAVSDAGKAGKVMVIGYHMNDALEQYMNQKVLTATMLLNPYNIGYFGVFYAGSYISELEEIRENKEENTMKDGKLREPSVQKVVDTGAFYVTSDNLGSDEVKLIRDPIGYTKK